ncbi:hypothetical protein AAJ76_196000387 [Vairimorpha ceranae]|uniref:Uncharacterized protein n=2 Tax=Vairimorpha ceranae TaxID=40302 RepID=A0A0F9WAB2_9MICR|nr:hypothetical protein AAJ76_196000387 [Vairimorpha ceranae]KKO73865.1 hypothetical protein AAJ76_196000387 [Vairimorpha ceranae]
MQNKRREKNVNEINAIFEEEIGIKLEEMFCNACLGRVKQVLGDKNIIRCTRRKCRKSGVFLTKKPYYNTKLHWEDVNKILFFFK